MTRRRFYAGPEAFAADGKLVTLSGDETQHLRSVLRLKVGYEVYVFDGAGHEFSGEIDALSRNDATVRIRQEVPPSASESSLDLTMAVALLKGEKFDIVVQKLTELGVNCVVPLVTTRADVRIRTRDDAHRKLIRWQRIVLEATKQCGRARLMQIESPITFEGFISRAGQQLCLMFSERDGASFSQLEEQLVQERGAVTALVGSEGGWTDVELNLGRATGWQLVTMRGRIMRAETAAISFAAVLQHRFGDLN